MRLPIIPFLVAATLLGAVWYLATATRSTRRILDVPRLNRIVDIEGIETEVAVSPDGNRLAAISNGDLWIAGMAGSERRQLTRTPEEETFPNWSPDGRRITFSRGPDTFAIDVDSGAEHMFLANATWLSWSHTSRTTFVRDRALWVANPNVQDVTKLVDADMVPDIDIRAPRFSPDALQIAFIKSQLGVRGEVWVVDALKGMSQPLVADRVAENPSDVAWINEGKDLAYLTNRAGAYSIWYVDFAASAIYPLTQPLVTAPYGRLGIAAVGDRVFVPRHFLDSNIVLSDGTAVANSDKIEFQPAVSHDGKRVAYTVADENKLEIWTAGIAGEQPAFRTLGREPRFSPNNLEIVYTYTDLSGNDDIWKLDIRNGSAERVTDADEIDITADWSPDGQSIAFTSARGGALSVWTVPASGGKRLRINDAGYAPRFSPDARTIVFWNKDALWSMAPNGNSLREAVRDVPKPAAGVWARTKGAADVMIRPPADGLLWPGFDALPDGRFAWSAIDIHETALWAVELTYKEQ